MYILNACSDQHSVYTEGTMTNISWNEIQQLYHDFINKDLEPRNYPHINREVAESWVRSRQFGVNPHDCSKTGSHLNQNELIKYLNENNLLIDITTSFINKIKEQIFIEDNGLYLFDKKGILLLNEDHWKESAPFGLRGSSFNENDIGTNSHMMCMRLKRPVQLHGPEHYRQTFHSVIASSAPILDENNMPLGAITLVTKILTNQHWQDFQKFYVHSLNMVSILAATIETQIKQRNDYDHAKYPTKQSVSCFVRLDNAAKYSFHEIIGESDAIKQAKDMGRHFALSKENILLIGESGTGKELFAQSIHNQSHCEGPFMAVNCAAIPSNLIESELFGYESGAFTGAEKNGRQGKIELANGGTLFLDEIGDMPLEMQAVLLRAIEEKMIMRIGGHHYKRVDFRVIAATNKDLSRMVEEHTFREDLYFRLSVLPIYIPPLRERDDDTIILARHIIKQYCREEGRAEIPISPAAKKKIAEFHWPGNIRQLKNAMIYAVNSTRNNVIELENLPCNVVTNNPLLKQSNPKRLTSLHSWEKAGIENALMLTGNHITRAAELLEISKATMYRKLKEYNITVDKIYRTSEKN